MDELKKFWQANLAEIQENKIRFAAILICLVLAVIASFSEDSGGEKVTVAENPAPVENVKPVDADKKVVPVKFNSNADKNITEVLGADSNELYVFDPFKVPPKEKIEVETPPLPAQPVIITPPPVVAQEPPKPAIKFLLRGTAIIGDKKSAILQKIVDEEKISDAENLIVEIGEILNGKKILEIAEEARKLKVDMLVLDDGWFINRNNDNRALGDWIADEAKLGFNLGELVKYVNKLGLKFGLWVEPEMISENSRLYHEHPEWAMIIPDDKPVLGRNQLVLDLSRHDVREYIFNSVSKLLEQADIEYLKWDYNRSINEVFSHKTNNGKVIYDYMLGLYEILERINKRYPDVLIEGCAGGGGRFDAGMLYYTPQIWCSDNTDAIDLLKIHYGTSYGYPAIVVSAHVSSSSNHQTGRFTPLKTRYTVAMSGTFGYELNPLTLSNDEKNEIISQIEQYRKDSAIISDGLYYRLSNPENETFCAWEYLSRDGSVALINVVVLLNHGNMPQIYITPRGLTSGTFYRDIENGKIYASDALMDSGFPLKMPKSDFEGYTFRLERLS